MPGRFVGPFVGFEVSDFRLGGDVSALVLVGAKWRRFGEQALETAGLLRGVSDGGFVGSEGDRFRELINGEFPSHLDVAGGAHVGVGDAIAQYARLLEGQKAQMRGLRENARVDHGVVNSTAMQLNAAEAAAAAAAGTPGAAAAIAAMEQARLAHEAAWVKWEQDLASAKAIKEVLGAGVDVQVQKIASQARKRFEENPNFLQELWQKLDDFMDKNADWLKVISDALQLIGGILALIPGLQVIGIALYAVGLGLKGLLAATGNASWEEFAFDALTSGAVGGLGKLAKLGKLGSTAQNLATKGSKLSSAAASFVKSQAKSAAKLAALRSADGMRFIANEQLAKTMYSKVTRGGQICFAAEPVDMATGNMVDFVTDVHISGVLPLVVDRHANSSHQMGRVLGPQWVSRADTHIEVMKDEILMVSPDGALLTFPLPPVDGSEVRADGRPWLLSFGDGAYRVRDISAGVVYEFRVYDLDPAEAHRSRVTTKPGAIVGSGGVVDGVPCVGGSMVGVGITPGSIADTWDIGVEIGLSALVHHTGHRIEYVWDQASGLMTAMVRSDGTRVDLGYDMVIGRLSDVWVSNPHTHPDQEPVKVIGYEYDADGQLARVRNSHDGILEYHYDSHGRAYAWTDRNGVSYFYRFDDQGRVVTQVGTGGMFPNALIWLEDTGSDAPLGGTVCVLVEAAGAFHQDPLVAGDSVVDEYFTRIEQLPLVKTLRSGGLAAAGMTGSGRMGPRDTDAWTVPEEWLHDEFLGDIRPTVYRATAAGDVWRIITAEGRVQDSEYNEYHKVIRSIDTTGKSSKVSYNEDGLVTETIFPDGSSVRVEPGSWGVPVRVVGRDGLVSEYEVDACGLVTRVVDPTGAVTCCEFEYRSSGVVPHSMVDAAGVRTMVECDDAGRTVAVVDAAGGRTSYVRDVRGLVSEVVDPVGAVTQVSYSPEGWVESVVQPDGGTRVFGYDGEGNITEAVSEIGAVTRTRFTVFDKPVEVVDPTGSVTRCTYNTQMQPVAITNGDGHTWRFVYGLDGQVVSETDYNGVTTTTSTTTDSDGVVTRVASAAGVKTVRVNRLGLVDSVSDAAGVIRYSYDELGRVRSVTTPETTVVFGVDEYGRRISETVTLASGESTTTQVEFDPIGRVVAEHTTTPTGQVISGFVTHDEVTGLIASTLISRSTVDKVAAGVPGQVVTECGFGVDAASRRSWMHTGSLVREYAYDRCSRKTDDHTYVLDATAPGGRRRMSGYGLSWRVDDVIVGVADHLRGMKTFDVDVMGKITAVTTQPPAHTPTGHTPTGHTPSLASSQASSGVTSEVYGFSAAGVLTSIRTDAQFQADGGYVPSSVSGVVSDVEFSGTRPVRVGRTRYEYDPAGRVIRTVTKRLSKKPLVKTFFYAGTSTQPVGFTSSDTPQVGYKYIYDGLGRRVAKETIDTGSGQVLVRVMFTHTGDLLTGEHTTYTTTPDTALAAGVTTGGDGVVGRMWIYDPDTVDPIGQITLTTHGQQVKPADVRSVDPGSGGVVDPADPSRVLSWSQEQVDVVFAAMTTDLAGAPLELVDPDSGEVTGCSVQSLYGQRIWRGKNQCPLLFAGQYEDTESGWVYNRYRYYQPEAGIYNAQDPLGVTPNIATPQGYVTNPTTLIDYYGLKAHEIPKADIAFLRSAQADINAQFKIVAEQWNDGAIGYTRGQLSHIVDKGEYWARPMHRGTQLDSALKSLVSDSEIVKLYKLEITPQGASGADFKLILPESQQEVWLDLTTKNAWQNHVRKYGTIDGIDPVDQFIGYQAQLTSNGKMYGANDIYGKIELFSFKD